MTFPFLCLLLAASSPQTAPAAAPPASGTTPGGIYYEISGAGDTVVLIHAFSLDRRMWQGQVAALDGRHRVIRYDLRGHGKSAAPDAPYSAVEDLASVLDAAGVPRAALVGLSAGSEVAVDFALTYPARVTRLVLASPGLSGYRPSAPLDWMMPVFQAAGAGDPDRAATLWAETPIMALRANPAATGTVRELTRDNRRLWTFKSNPAKPIAPPAIGRLGEIHLPALILLGEMDLPHIKEVAGLLKAGISGSRLETLQGAGHILNLDLPDRFNSAVEAFLTER